MLKKLVPVFLVVAALAMIAVFLDSSVFVIKDVRIEGESGMDDRDVMRLAGLQMEGRMRKLDVSSVKRGIESTGALRFISVEKELPSTVVITVERRIGRMAADYGGSIALLDEDGYVISVTREMPEGDYLYVTGLAPRDAVPGRMIGADSVRIDALCTVLDAIDATGSRMYISEINVADVSSIYLYSRTGIQVELGDSGDMENKLIWMSYAIADLEGRGETSGRLDVTGGNQADFSAY